MSDTSFKPKTGDILSMKRGVDVSMFDEGEHGQRISLTLSMHNPYGNDSHVEHILDADEAQHLAFALMLASCKART